MATPENCPCDAVREIKELVSQHDRQLNQGNVQFAIIQQKLEYIIDRVDEKKKFNMQTVSAVIQAILTLVVTLIIAKMGLS